MRHIRQINSVGTDSYTVVIANEPLEQHPSILEHPEWFEISEDDIPEKHQYLNYQDWKCKKNEHFVILEI